MINEADVAVYRRDGYIVVPDVISQAELEALRGATEGLVAAAHGIMVHNDIYDLEPDHRPERRGFDGSLRLT
jgi:hypothetical protein